MRAFLSHYLPRIKHLGTALCCQNTFPVIQRSIFELSRPDLTRNASTVSSYTLTYFNGKARGEVARILFALADVEFDDIRIKEEEWPVLKPNTPMGQLPVLKVDGLQISQSFAICRLLAKRFGYLGEGDFEEAVISMVCHVMDDMINSLEDAWDPNTEKDYKKKLIQRFTDVILPEKLHFLNKQLINNQDGSAFFVGKSMTIADIYFSHYIEVPELLGIEIPFIDYPNLERLKERVDNDPRIADWYKSRPDTPW